MDFCFVHASDLHLGGRRWLRSTPSDARIARSVSLADRLALGALVDLCLAERAKMLLCSGDIIDGWCRNHQVGLVLVQELLRLRHAGCEVVLLLGNHDVRTRVMKPLLLPQHAFVLGRHGPETRVLERLGVALHGWSFPEPEAPVDVASLYPAPLAGHLNIGLLHTSAEGRNGHANYAPCSRRTLRGAGYDYWALGHVHAREVIATEPWIVFPGNLQGRGPREAGPKGATLVQVRAGRIASVEHRSLDALRFATVVVDTNQAERFDDVLTAAHAALVRATGEAEGRPLVARLVLEGAAGAACALAVPPWERGAALGAVTRALCDHSVWVDETWIDTGVGSWLVDVAA
jgi:exonuclease SbcD